MVFKKIIKFIKSALGIKRQPDFGTRKKAGHSSRKINKPTIRLKSSYRKSNKKKKPKKRKTIAKKLRLSKRSKPKKSRFHAEIMPPVIGDITHYFPQVKAAVIRLRKPLILGDPVRIKGKHTDFRQTVASMQVNRKPIEKAKAGQEIGLEVMRDVHPGDLLYQST